MYRISQAVALGALTLMQVPALHAQTRRVATAAPTAVAAALACTPSAEGTPGGVLARVAQAVGMNLQGSQALRVRWSGHVVNDFQSDRTYAPFFSMFQAADFTFDPRGGGQGMRGRGGAYVGSELPAAPFVTLSGPWASWITRDTLVRAGGTGADTRYLNPWAAVRDFLRPREAQLEGRCIYRDYPRIALTRTGIYGVERLLVDPKTMIPVGLVREEPHPLWGQVRVDYVWSNWDDVTGGGVYPFTTFRMVDGEPNVGLTVTSAALIPADSAPRLTIPDTMLRTPAANPRFATPAQPDTVRVDDHTFLLVNESYTIAVTLLRDTVFVLDATLSEPRARQDADWITRLFPGRHPVVLVVTDLAWPHIGGVRYWVASGATIVSHRASRAFLQRIVDRRWTREPDLLEQTRARARFTFRAVDDSLVLAGGDLVLHAIDGMSSEGALIGWLPGGHFLWASDYIQNLRQPSGYVREVFRATRRAGVRPTRFAAQHVGLTPWTTIEGLTAGEPGAASAEQPDAGLLRVGSLTKTASVSRGGQSMDRGAQTQQLSRGSYRGRPAIISVTVFPTPQGPATDSSTADAVTLAPIRHVGVHQTRTMVLDFAGSRVTGSYRDSSGTRPIDQALQARPYDSSLYDLVFAALPLAEGYRARLPFYIYEQGAAPVWWDGRVTGAETIVLRDGSSANVWVLDVSEGGQPRSRLWITRTGEREVVRSTYYISPGMEYTVSR